MFLSLNRSPPMPGSTGRSDSRRRGSSSETGSCFNDAYAIWPRTMAVLGFRFDGHQLAAAREHVEQVDRAVFDGPVGGQIDRKTIGLQVKIIFLDRIAARGPE